MIVVDASVVVKWVVEEPGSPEAEAMLASDLRFGSPDILVPEVVNVLRKKILRGQMTRAQAATAVDRVFEPVARFAAVSEFREALLDLAVKLKHPAYDCAYIHCAALWDAPLVTADAVLERKCLEAGHQAYGLSDWRAVLAR